jgi:cell division protein FtsZ
MICNKSQTRIKILGVGGGGSAIAASIIKREDPSLEIIIANTDVQALAACQVPRKIQLGVKATKGLGAGAHPEIGRNAAQEDLDAIINVLADADMVFLVGGLGGGTASGALPVITHALKEREILSVVFVTEPFMFEGKRRSEVARDALDALKKDADTLLIVSNQKLLALYDRKSSFLDAFNKVNGVLYQLVSCIADIVQRKHYTHATFADIKALIKQKGFGKVGMGRASGKDRIHHAVAQALSFSLSPDISLIQECGILAVIASNTDIALSEMNQAASLIYERVHDDANVIIEPIIDRSLAHEVMVTLMVTGYTTYEKYENR